MYIENFKETIDVSPIPTFIINHHHKVIYWNSALENLSGISSGSIIGTDRQWRAFYSEQRPVMADLVIDEAPSEVLKSYYNYHKSQIIRGAYIFDDFFPSLGRGGKWFHITVNSGRDPSGHVTTVMTTLEDITEGKVAEKKLIESEERYKTLFESAQDAIIVHNLRGVIQIANCAASDLSGYSHAELIGKNVLKLFTGFKLKQKLFNYPQELSLNRKDGQQLICRITSNEIVRERGNILCQNIIRDITEEKRVHENLKFYLKQVTIAQEEERKRIARELHDDTLQTLHFLSRGINNFVLKNPDLNTLTYDFLENTRVELDQAAKNLQSFSQALRLSILDDLGLIPALRHLTRDLSQAGIKVELAMHGYEKRLASETETMLFRIVQEYFNNIRKHSQASEVILSIDFTKSKLKISVQDNGCGFEPQERLDEIPRDGKLGLAGIAERVRLLGGILSINSQKNKETSLSVEIEI